jgi:signal transduction histidine kinase
MPITPTSTNVSTNSFMLKPDSASVCEPEDTEQTYQFLFELVPQPLIVYDEGLRILAVNEAAISTYGYSKNEFLSLTITEIENPVANLSVTADDGFVRHRTKTNTTIQVEIASRPVMFEGKCCRLLAVSDAGKRELPHHLQDNGHGSLTQLGILVAAVAHEVRNPLFALSSVLDALEQRFNDSAEVRRYHDVLRSEVERLVTLMEDLLEYGKTNRNQPDPASLHEIVTAAIRSCRRHAEAVNITLVNNVPDKLPNILVDKRRASTILSNLVENAIQHSPSGCRVTINAARTCAKSIQCVVSDRGPGISPQDLPRIFEPFFTKRPGGTGLGLSIAQKAINEMNGELSARNNRTRGSSLVATFPIALEVSPND